MKAKQVPFRARKYLQYQLVSFGNLTKKNNNNNYNNNRKAKTISYTSFHQPMPGLRLSMKLLDLSSPLEFISIESSGRLTCNTCRVEDCIFPGLKQKQNTYCIIIIFFAKRWQYRYRINFFLKLPLSKLSHETVINKFIQLNTNMISFKIIYGLNCFSVTIYCKTLRGVPLFSRF